MKFEIQQTLEKKKFHMVVHTSSYDKSFLKIYLHYSKAISNIDRFDIDITIILNILYYPTREESVAILQPVFKIVPEGDKNAM